MVKFKKRLNESGNAGVVIIAYLLILVGAGYGWVCNILEVVEQVSNPVTGMFILRCIGIVVAPLGVVLGYI